MSSRGSAKIVVRRVRGKAEGSNHTLNRVGENLVRAIGFILMLLFEFALDGQGVVFERAVVRRSRCKALRICVITPPASPEASPSRLLQLPFATQTP